MPNRVDTEEDAGSAKAIKQNKEEVVDDGPRDSSLSNFIEN